MPRLLILCEYPTLLGGERSMLATLPAVAAADFEIFVAAPPTGSLAAELNTCGVEHIAWPTHDDHGQRIALDQLRSSLASVIRQVRPSLVHANSLSTARIAGPVTTETAREALGI